MASGPTPDPLAEGQVEIWKKIVDVQQHFNDLELRIRNFALAVAGAFLGLGGYAIKDGGFTTVLGIEVSVAGVVVLAAVFPLAAFYFMDRLWYHRLLEGSVAAGIKAEAALKTYGYVVDLGSEIKASSPFSMWFFGRRHVRSKHKMDLFYLILLVSLLVVAGTLGFGVQDQTKKRALSDRPKLEQPAPKPTGTAKTSGKVVPKGIPVAAPALAPQARLSNQSTAR